MSKADTIARRTVLSATVVAPAALLLPSSGVSADDGKPFVLVHGAWHGGWCWRKLTPLLRARGRTVLTPTLTGLGERSHLLAPDVDLDTHIADIAAVLEYEDLTDVILVGHSYAGMVIAGVAEKASSRLAQLVYLDAFLPDDGKAVADYAPLAPTRDDGWRVPPPSGPRDWGVRDDEDIAWMESRLGDHPHAAFTQPVSLSSGGRLPGTFIQCSEAPFFAEAAARARERGFQYRALLSAGHDAMVSQPEELAELLLAV